MNQYTSFSHKLPLELSAAGHSETGRLLKRNADAFALFDRSDTSQAERWGRLYILADGIGSHPGGEIASRIAVETIPAAYYRQSKGDSPLGRLQQAFLAAHTRIHEVAAQQPEYSGMATTCTAVVIKGTRIWIAHVGDSRAYLIRASSPSQPTITRLTTDHSLVAAQVRAGSLSPEEMRDSPADRDILLRALGGSAESPPYPDFTMQEVRAGDVLMLCSDGLWSAVTEEQITRVVFSMPAQQACEALVRLANEAGEGENISVVMLSFSSTAQPSSHKNWRKVLFPKGERRS